MVVWQIYFLFSLPRVSRLLTTYAFCSVRQPSAGSPQIEVLAQGTRGGLIPLDRDRSGLTFDSR